MSYYRFGELRVISVTSTELFIHFFQMGFNQPNGLDRTRGYPIGVKDFQLVHLEEAYTTENWLVRIYRVVDRNNRPSVKYTERQVKSKKSKGASKKVDVLSIVKQKILSGTRQEGCFESCKIEKKYFIVKGCIYKTALTYSIKSSY